MRKKNTWIAVWPRILMGGEHVGILYGVRIDALMRLHMESAVSRSRKLAARS